MDFFLWRFDPTPDHVLHFRGFVITLVGKSTLGISSLDE
jgi:hypothetical protein